MMEDAIKEIEMYEELAKNTETYDDGIFDEYLITLNGQHM